MRLRGLRFLPGSRIITLPCFVVLFSAKPCSAQQVLWLQQVSMHDPIAAEPHPDAMRLSFGEISEYQYARSPGSRLGADLDVGGEVPIVAVVRGNPKLRPTSGEWRVGLFLPVSFHMLWDLHDPSLPIINNDYRFSYAMVKAMIGTGGSDLVPSQLETRWKIYAHESSHLGDELTIAAEDSVLLGGPTFTRVNVSYEWYEVSFGGRWENLGAYGGSLVLRTGWTRQVNADGFYGDSVSETTLARRDTLQIEQVAVAESYRHAEPFLRGELRYGCLLVSADASNRIQLDYARSGASPPEGRVWSYNLLVGYQDAARVFGERGKADLFLRFYDGINPHGQFRSQRDFRMLAIGLFMPV